MRPALTLLTLGLASAVAWTAPQRLSLAPQGAILMRRAPPVIASAKIIPAANVGLGSALIVNAASAGGSARVVLGATGLLALFNLAVTDNARYAGAKRAMKLVDGVPKGQKGLAQTWYNCVRIQVFGQLVGLLWMVRAECVTGVLRGATTFMAANLLFFLLGAAPAKHDADGRQQPIKPGVAKFVLITDAVLTAAALLGSMCAAGTAGRAVGSYVFAAGCMIGAVEGFPLTLAAVRKLMKL